MKKPRFCWKPGAVWKAKDSTNVVATIIENTGVNQKMIYMTQKTENMIHTRYQNYSTAHIRNYFLFIGMLSKEEVEKIKKEQENK